MFISETNSTNDYLKQHGQADHVWTGFQTAGRGQMGNGWESERGKNVLLSVRLHPDGVAATEQWKLSMQVSVVLWQVVSGYVEDRKLLTIKWPNDLYYGDRKLAGVLVENTLRGAYIEESIVGIGLNVNQTRWEGSAPNPISIRQITDEENNVEELVEKLTTNLCNIGVTSADWEGLYMQHLYRSEGWWWWEEREVNNQPTMPAKKSEQSFEAEIAGITEQGELVLRRRNKEERTYHFKQIKYILQI